MFSRGEKVRLRFINGERKSVAQHYVERVLAQPHDQQRIVTTLDASLQRDVAGIIAAQKQNLLNHNAQSVAAMYQIKFSQGERRVADSRLILFPSPARVRV